MFRESVVEGMLAGLGVSRIEYPSRRRVRQPTSSDLHPVTRPLNKLDTHPVTRPRDTPSLIGEANEVVQVPIINANTSLFLFGLFLLFLHAHFDRARNFFLLTQLLVHLVR